MYRILTALFAVSSAMVALPALSSAQQPRVRTRAATTPRTPTPRTRRPRRTNAPVLTGACHRKTSGTEARYTGVCMAGQASRNGKTVACNGAQPMSSLHKTQDCDIRNVSGVHDYRLTARGSRGVAAKDAADFACGCGPHKVVPNTSNCSGGLCSADQN